MTYEEELYAEYSNYMRQEYAHMMKQEAKHKYYSPIVRLEELCRSNIFGTIGIDPVVQIDADPGIGIPFKYTINGAKVKEGRKFVKINLAHCEYEYKGYSPHDADEIFEIVATMQDFIDDVYLRVISDMKQDGTYYNNQNWVLACIKFLTDRQYRLKELGNCHVDDIDEKLTRAMSHYNCDIRELEVVLIEVICDAIEAMGYKNIMVDIILKMPVNYWTTYPFDEVPYMDIQILELTSNNQGVTYHYRWFGDTLVSTKNKKSKGIVLGSGDQIYVDRLLAESARIFHNELEKVSNE